MKTTRIFLFAVVALALILPASPFLAQTPPPAQPAAPSPDEKEMQSLLDEGNKTNAAGNYTDAIKTWITGLEKAKTLNNKAWMYKFLFSISDIYQDKSLFKEALPYLLQRLDVSKPYVSE